MTANILSMLLVRILTLRSIHGSVHDVKLLKLRGKVSNSVKRAPVAHSIDAHERIVGRLRLHSELSRSFRI